MNGTALDKCKGDSGDHRRRAPTTLIRMMRRVYTFLAAIVPAILLGILATTMTVPLVAMGPGPTFDTLGDMDADESDDEQSAVAVPVVEIIGRDSDPTSGRLDMTTVAVRDRLTFVDAMRYWIDDEQAVVPRDQVFPPNRSRDEVQAENSALMTGSENTAEIAAYRQLEIDLEVIVDDVVAGGAADGVLRSGDVLISIDGTPVQTATQIVDAVADMTIGEQIELTYRRDGQQKKATLHLKQWPGEPPEGSDADRGYLGIRLGEQPSDGTDVRINLDSDVGGPSAGLVFALAIIDKLSPGELTGGAAIAGTGTIDPDGHVGPIGGITHKLVAASKDGATEFLVPADNCAEAVLDPPEGMRLIKVSSLAEAVDALDTVRAGGSPTTCD